MTSCVIECLINLYSVIVKYKENLKYRSPPEEASELLNLNSELSRVSGRARDCSRTLGGFMTPTMLRQLWSLVETTQASLLISLDDAALAQCLINKLQAESSINGTETHAVNDYISSRVSLIRDVAESRLTTELV